MGQEQYNLWVQRTKTDQQNEFCGGRQVSKNEKYFIENYALNNILYIGCGTGHRTFPIWIEKNLFRPKYVLNLGRNCVSNSLILY
ncbi:MAG: hypothetical protein M0Q45_06500 [Bacteroidales bacterium]|nr:hypothetical protein [Bacteroidales bacterium]MCK9499139.1 hypothetical protein [Bacteroidales bacterium]